MGKKLLVSLAMEGKFANHGLQALDDDDDMLTAMARELVTEKGVGEKADACWREVQREHGRLLEAQRTAVVLPGIPWNGSNRRHVRSPLGAPTRSSSWRCLPRRLVGDLVMTERHSSRLVSERSKLCR